MKDIEPIRLRINELAAIAKERELTEEELSERAHLREEYLAIFRAGFRQQLLHTTVMDSEGNDVTPEKLRRAKADLDEEGK